MKHTSSTSSMRKAGWPKTKTWGKIGIFRDEQFPHRIHSESKERFKCWPKLLLSFVGFLLSVNSSTNLDAKEMQFCPAVCCRRQQSNTKPSTNMSIHQCINLLNIITPTNSDHLSKLISADYCIGESDAQKSLSIRMRNSCKIGKEKSTISCCL